MFIVGENALPMRMYLWKKLCFVAIHIVVGSKNKIKELFSRITCVIYQLKHFCFELGC